jgi:hypothetical protein
VNAGQAVTPAQTPLGVGGTPLAMTSTDRSRLPPGFRDDLAQVAQAIQNALPDGMSLPAINGSYTKAEMLAQFQSWLALYDQLAAAVLAEQNARQALKAALPAAEQYYAEVKGVLTGYFHAGNPALAQFGYKPKKAPAPRTVQKKAEAAVRGQETRVIRGTLGKRAKLALKYAGPVSGAAASAPVATATAPPTQGTSTSR